ncbi:9061_t:CDS:1, partial [Scutellospora calospora]
PTNTSSEYSDAFKLISIKIERELENEIFNTNDLSVLRSRIQ